MKKAVSANIFTPDYCKHGNGAHTDSGSENSSSQRLNTRLLPKEVIEKIREENEATPITGNTLANYRNFKLKAQKEAE
jgi:hypothetical protein